MFKFMVIVWVLISGLGCKVQQPLQPEQSATQILLNKHQLLNFSKDIDQMLRMGKLSPKLHAQIHVRSPAIVRYIKSPGPKLTPQETIVVFKQVSAWVLLSSTAMVCFERSLRIMTVVSQFDDVLQPQAQHLALATFEGCSRRTDAGADAKAYGASKLSALSQQPLWLKNKSVATRLDGVLRHIDRGHGAPKTLGKQDDAYNAQTYALLDCILVKDAVTVDVGTFKGDVLYQMLKRAPEGKHFGFEPLPFLLPGLLRRFKGQPVKIYPVALADKAGQAQFTHVMTNAGYSGLKARDYDKKERTEQITVTVKTMDDVLGHITRLDFIKADVEGAEYGVLKGAKDLIKRTQPVVVFEFSTKSAAGQNVTPKMMHTLLRGYGMQINTMAGFLIKKQPLTLDGFVQSLNQGAKDYYFVAYDERKAATLSCRK